MDAATAGPARRFDEALAAAARQLDALRAANRAADHHGSGAAAAALREALRVAAALVKQARAEAREDAGAMEARLSRQQAESQAELSGAFAPSRAAIRQAVYGVDRAQWDREVATWSAARGRPGALAEHAPSAEPLDAAQYWAKYGAQTMQAALERAMGELVFDIAGPGLTFSTNECGAFILAGFGGRMLATQPHHVSQLLDTPLYELIDGVRAVDDRGRAPDAFEPAVVSRIVERLGLGIRRAVARLALPYAGARSRAIAAAETASHAQAAPGLDAPAGTAEASEAQPAPSSLGARTTIEHAVAEAMCAGLVAFDPAGFSMLYDLEIPGEPRAAQLALERGRGDWLMVRVLAPADATTAEVATALYGTPELAHLLVGAGDRYAYVFPPGRQLAEPYETEFHNHMIDEGADGLDAAAIRSTRDPVLGLDAGLADQRALASVAAVGAVADGAGAAPALQRLEILQSVLDGIVTAAAPLGVAPAIAPLQARIQERRTACEADPAEAQRWAAHAAAQLALLSEAKTGFDAITQQLLAMGLPGVSTADGEQLAGDVTAAMQGPTRELAAAYADAAAASEQLDLGGERLAIAKERLAVYPFDMVDRMLAVIRRRIAATSQLATVPMKSYEAARMDALQAEISTTVGQLRLAVVNGDGTAALRLGMLRAELLMLDLQSTLGSTLTAIAELKGELFRAESMAPDAGREAWIYDQLHAAMQDWMQLASDYDELWQAGQERDPSHLASVRARVAALREQTNLPALVHELTLFAEDEAERQRWINIGLMLGAALLAAASGGLASGAIGGFAGAVFGAGVEALTFTAITSTLHQDPSFGGFMAELGLNFATFGGLRAISGGARALAGSRGLTVSEKLGELTLEGLWMVASVKAHEQIQEALAHGGAVTPQSAAAIFGQQMAISFAARVLVRVGGVLVQGVTGAEKLAEVRVALAKRAEEEALARQVMASGDGKLGEELVKADTAALRAEQRALERVREVAGDPAEAARHGIAAEPGAVERLAADADALARQLREREIAELMQQVEVKADHAIAESAVYAELVAKHRAQGATVAEGFDAAGQPRAAITPRLADGSPGSPFTLHARLGAEVEQILAAKQLPHTAIIGDYLGKRAGDRPGALADLRKVNTPAELDQLMKRTLGEEAVAARELAVRTSAQEQLIRDVFGTSPGPELVRELARIPALGRPLLEQLASRGLSVAEQLGASLVRVPGWPERARLGLVKLAASDTPDAIRLFAKVSANIEIGGMNTWVLLASRQLKERTQLLDLEQSLDKAIQARRLDPDTAMEVDYYRGKRVRADELATEKGDPNFERKRHKNIDVESSSARWELKRVNPIVTTHLDFIKQIKEGSNKYISAELPNAKSGGGKVNIVDVEFGDRVQIPGIDEAWIRARVELYLEKNTTVRHYVDEFVIRIEYAGSAHVIVIGV